MNNQKTQDNTELKTACRSYPLTDSQTGVYLKCLSEPGTLSYNIPFVYSAPKDERIDFDRLVNAFRAAIDNHEIFRMTVREIGGKPQLTAGNHTITVQKVKIKETDFPEYLKTLIRPFDLNGGELARSWAIETESHIHMVNDFHHIIYDGYSNRVFVDDVTRAYAGEPLSKEDLTFFDRSVFEANLDPSQKKQATEDFCNRFGGFDLDSTPVGDIVTADNPGKRSNVVRIPLYTETDSSLEDFLSAGNCRRPAFFLSAFAYTLAKFNNSTSAVFTTGHNGRTDKRYMNSIGMFVRTFPIVLTVDDNLSAAEWVQTVHQEYKRSKSDDCFNFTDISSAASFNTNVTAVYQGELFNYPAINGVNLTTEFTFSEAQNHLLVEFYLEDNRYIAEIQYRSDIYSAEFVQSFAKTMSRVIEGMLSGCKMKDIVLIDETQKARLDSFNASEAEYDKSTVVEQFLAHAQKNPDAECVVFRDKHYTYGEVEKITHRLATYIKSLGIGRGDFVGIMIPRCEYMPICALGVLRAGAAYMPMDPGYPSDRLNLMLKDSGARMLISTDELTGIITDDFTGLRKSTAEIPLLPASDETLPLPSPDDNFVILYTSGSTGVPKGVVYAHSNVSATVAWTIKIFEMDQNARHAAYASYGFDANVQDMYSTLAAGAVLHIVPDDIRLDLPKIREYFNDNKITSSVMTTQVARQFALFGGTPSLRHLMCGGEKLTPFYPPANPAFHNGYGPTEGTVISTEFTLDGKYRDIPIGKPVDNLKIYIVDRCGRRVPAGAAGELWISGPHVTKGYLNRPKETAESYISNYFEDIPDYGRIYKTGDIARYLPDGNLQFIGRRDAQVKIRGFRIELTEVEEIIRRFDGIENATVVAYDNPDGTKFIAAYVVSEKQIDIEALNTFILSEKPSYMVPEVTMQIDEIPMNRNQKVNKRALPRPERKIGKISLPVNEIQQKIYDIAADILGHRDFGTDTDLFTAGLSSIASLRLNVALSEQFCRPVLLSDLKANSTVLALEKLLDTDGQKPSENDSLLADYPLTHTQMGVFVDCSASPDTINYNIPMVIRLSPAVDLRKMIEAIKAAINAHPYVKTTLFADSKGNIRARRNDSAKPKMSFIASEKAPDWQLLVKPFELLGSPLYRIGIFRTDEGNFLFLDFHHIISDGTSEAILLSDIGKAYAGETLATEKYTGFEIALDEEKARLTDRFGRAKAYFDGVFTGCETECLPPSAPESDTVTVKRIKRLCNVSHEKINNFCTKNSFTPNAFFNSAFGFALSRFTRPDDVVFTTVYNGRADSRVVSCVTMLVKTLPVLVCTKKDRPIAELIHETQEHLLNSMTNDIFSFAEISTAYGIRADIILVYQGDNFVFNTFCGEKAEIIDIPVQMNKAPLCINIFLNDEGYEFVADYRCDMFCSELIDSLLSAFEKTVSEFIVRKTLREITLLTERDEEKLAKINSTARPYENIPAHRFIERTAASCPDRPAVICGGKQLTFDGLNRLANQIAAALIANGTAKDSIIGMMLDRSVEVYAAEIGILKAGGAFLGLLPSYPDERIEFCLSDSACKILITTDKLKAERAELCSPEKNYITLTLEEIRNAYNSPSDFENPDVDVFPDSLAYCIYTSGSTGKPKGVMIEHHSLVNCAQPSDFDYTYYCGKKRGKKALAMSSLSFDMSVFDSLLPMMNGMTVVSATDSEIHNPAAMAALIRDNRTDTFTATPSYLTNALGFEEFRNSVRWLHTIVSGAEAFSPVLYTTLKSLSPELTVLNGYGPTECAMTCCSKIITDKNDITIGGPGANISFYTADSFGNILPPYGCGELIICGECVGRGYINLPEKTAASFFTLRNRPAYHSGDIVRFNKSGEVEFFGRIDNQVKLRGFRIELDEIEKTICTFDGVRQSKVVVRNNGSEDYLAAFFTADRVTDIAALTDYLRSVLTYYMVPDVLSQLDSFPLTPSGKIDTKALPYVAKESRRSGRKAPKKSTEEMLCELFASVLGVDEIYADDNFFEMGGTSLSASKVTMQLMAKNIKVEYQNIFDNPTPELLSEFIDSSFGVKQAAPLTGAGSKTEDPIEDLIRSPYDEQLKYNTLSHAAEVVREPLGDVLLTGAVGFLGVHVLHELIELKEGKIICLVRKKGSLTPDVRLKNMLMYYFGDTFDSEFENRISVLDADITDANLASRLEKVRFDTLINCAACVKHYSADDSLEKINVHGVENLIKSVVTKNARMVQISTVSVPGVHTAETYKIRLKMFENHLFVIDSMDNKYGLSKYHAELKMLEAIKNGMRGKIIRVGNLMGRYSDGEFQINFSTNAFLNALRGFATIGKCPVSHATDPMSYSPVDMTAKAIVTLAGTNDCFTAFHADSRFGFDEMQLVDACNRCGITITPVDDNEYYADYNRMLADDNLNSRMQGLMTNDRPGLHVVEADNTFTANILYRLGFSWPLVEKEYLDRTVTAMKSLNFFEPDED